MRAYSWLAGAWLSWISGGAPHAALTPTVHAFVSFSSDVRGDFPPEPCGSSRGADVPGLPVEAFDEVTPANAPPASGSFDVVVATTCVAPFYQALLAHDSLGVRFMFTDADHRPVNEPLTLFNARFTHVDVVAKPDEPAPYVRIGIVASRVVAGDALAKAMSRRRAHAAPFRAPATDRLDEDASGEAWVRSGVGGMRIRLASAAPQMTASFVTTDWDLSVQSPRRANGQAPSTMRVTLDSRAKLSTDEREELVAALDARAPLTQALFEVVNAQGTSGITIRLKNATLARGDRASSRQSTIDLTAKQLSITDLASGRTASTP